MACFQHSNIRINPLVLQKAEVLLKNYLVFFAEELHQPRNAIGGAQKLGKGVRAGIALAKHGTEQVVGEDQDVDHHPKPR